jgi:hypothetical protein
MRVLSRNRGGAGHLSLKRDHFKWKHRSSVAALASLLARAILQENRYPLFLIALQT